MHAAFLSHVRQSCFFLIKQNFFWTTKFLEGDTGEASRFVTLNRPLQKARFSFQALLEFDWRVWMDQLTVHMTSDKVSLWRDTCNYKVLNLAVSCEVLLKQMKKSLAPHGLIMVPKDRIGSAELMASFSSGP